MALTDEELKLQLDILANRTDQNSSMVFKANAILNKGLNPDFFTGQSTKIVNALNDLAAKADQAIDTANATAAKINSMILDSDDSEKQIIWQELQELMGQGTLVEGLKEVLLGRKLQLMLDLKPEDVGKVLSVARKDDDSLVVKAIDMIAGGEGGSVADLVAEDIKYDHDTFKFDNVKNALDFILANSFGDNEQPATEIHWDDIIGKPEFANDLIMANGKLCLQSESGTVASVDITNDLDIDEIVNEL